MAESPPGLRVLAFDDDPGIRRFLAEALAALGYQARVFASGRETLDFLAGREGSGWPSVVMMDVSIPGEDGAETIRALRQLLPATPILLSSGLGRAEGAGELGADAFLPKPYRLAALRRALEALRR